MLPPHPHLDRATTRRHRLHSIQQQVQHRLLHQFRIRSHHHWLVRSVYRHLNSLFLHLRRRQLDHHSDYLPQVMLPQVQFHRP